MTSVALAVYLGAIVALPFEGHPFRVLLRCRSEALAWHGRLIFIDPQGRTRSEPIEAFHGGSVADVLSQALALSDRSLARRLRQALSN